MIRYGCYQLNKPLNKANDWIAIGDSTVSVGKTQCFAVLGIQISTLSSMENLTLTHKDVVVLGLYPTKKSTGEFINNALEDVQQRVGTISELVIDQGSDLKKGARLFKNNHPDIIVLHDISHKLANIVEKELKNDPLWPEYLKDLNLCKKRLHLTEFAALMPQKQREKARFMDIGHLVSWPANIRKSRREGLLKKISEEQYQGYFNWLNRYTSSLNEWLYIEEIVDRIKGCIRKDGLSIEVYNSLKTFLEEFNTKNTRIENFIEKSLKTVSEEVIKLSGDEKLISSTEVLESVFGKFKAINEAIHGISSNVLGMLTFIGEKKSEEEIIKAMESCSVETAFTYVKEKIGESICSLRRKFFPFKRTKFDINGEHVFAT